MREIGIEYKEEMEQIQELKQSMYFLKSKEII